MNYGSAYSRAAGRTEAFAKKAVEDPASDATIAPDGVIVSKKHLEKQQEIANQVSAKHQWLQSTVTQDLMKSFLEKEAELIDHSVALAEGYHINQNHHQIISNLIRVAELRRLVKEITSTK